MDETWKMAGQAAVHVVARAGLVAYLRSLANILHIDVWSAHALVERAMKDIDLDEAFGGEADVTASSE